MCMPICIYIYCHIFKILRQWSDGLTACISSDVGMQGPDEADADMEDSDSVKDNSNGVSQQAQPPATLVPVTPRQGASTAPSGCVVNSTTHPDAYAWLNRSAKSGRGILPPEVLAEWEAGGARRNKLLTSFVRRVYVPGAQQRTNVLRLEAWNRIQQCTKDFTKSFQGFEWHTEEELRTVLKWNEILSFLSYNLCNLFSKCCSASVLHLFSILLVDFRLSFCCLYTSASKEENKGSCGVLQRQAPHETVHLRESDQISCSSE